MGQAIEVISGFVTGPGATLTAVTVNAGNSLQIRSAPFDKKVFLVSAWAYLDTSAGVTRIRSPRLHDFVQGIRLRQVTQYTDDSFLGVSVMGWLQRLIPQDVLTVEQSGSAANIDTAHLLIQYDDLPGVAGRFIDNDLLNAAGVNRIGQEVSVTTTAASGQYTGQVSINATNDNFKANTDYALLGATCDTRVGTIRIQGVDTGNLGIGIPGEPTQRHVYANYFQRLSAALKKPMIPVFNSANKSAILVDCTGHTAAITTVLTFHMVELLPGKAPMATYSGGS
jgi:hypothetical protein